MGLFVDVMSQVKTYCKQRRFYIGEECVKAETKMPVMLHSTLTVHKNQD